MVAPAVRGERVAFIFSLQPHCLSPSRVGQWDLLMEELHSSVICLVACVCGGVIHSQEERRWNTCTMLSLCHLACWSPCRSKFAKSKTGLSLSVKWLAGSSFDITLECFFLPLSFLTYKYQYKFTFITSWDLLQAYVCNHWWREKKQCLANL